MRPGGHTGRHEGWPASRACMPAGAHVAGVSASTMKAEISACKAEPGSRSTVGYCTAGRSLSSKMATRSRRQVPQSRQSKAGGPHHGIYTALCTTVAGTVAGMRCRLPGAHQWRRHGDVLDGHVDQQAVGIPAGAAQRAQQRSARQHGRLREPKGGAAPPSPASTTLQPGMRDRGGGGVCRVHNGAHHILALSAVRRNTVAGSVISSTRCQASLKRMMSPTSYGCVCMAGRRGR